MSKYRVLIADDHPLAREAVRSLLADDESFDCVGEAANGEQVVTLCEQLRPDVIIMDINMPVLNGLEATRKIKQAYPHIRIVILSVSDDVAHLFTAIQFGAQGYLLKNMDPDDWITYLHALLDENSEISRQMADRLFYRFHKRAPALGESNISPLTPREKEIIVFVAEGETNRKIAERLAITENTVKNHIKSILEKLDLDNRVQLTAYAIRQGLTMTSQTRANVDEK